MQPSRVTAVPAVESSLTINLAKQQRASDSQTELIEHSVDFAKTPEWPELREAVERAFHEHEIEEYMIMVCGQLITENNWKRLAQEYREDHQVTGEVISLAKPFPEYEEQHAYGHLGLNRHSACKDEDAFLTADIDPHKELREDVIRDMGLKTQGDLLEHIGRELALRCLHNDPAEHTSQFGKQELIEPVLFGVAALAGEVDVISDLSILGKLGKGKVDYVIQYKGFYIVVTEAKWINQWETLQEHFGQLAAQMRAAREQFIYKRLGQRALHEADEEFLKVPSYGIITNGTSYLLYKYDPAAESDERRLLRCFVPVLLKRGMKAKAATEQATEIIKRLLPVVQQLRDDMDGFYERRGEKKPRLG